MKKYEEIIDLKERRADLYEHTVMVTLLSVMVAKKLKLDKNKTLISTLKDEASFYP